MKHSDISFMTPRRKPRATGKRGFIMIALLIIVTLMLFYVVASSRVLYQVQRELTALERSQTKRLTNSPPAAVVVSELRTNEIAGGQQQTP